jgi:lysophospholipase L1-like esterase
MDDYDLKTIARIYGVKVKEIKKLEAGFDANISRLSENLKEKMSKKPSLSSPCRVLAIGDSITSDRESYVKILNRLWEDDPNREMIDCAVSGHTTGDVINRFYSTAMNQVFEWAVIFLGTNDSRGLDDGSNIENISFDEYKQNIKYFTETLLKSGKKVIHITVPYVDNEVQKEYFADTRWTYDLKRIDHNNEYIRELSKKLGTQVADLAVRLKDYEGNFFEEDGVHLNGEAQSIICELLLDILP